MSETRPRRGRWIAGGVLLALALYLCFWPVPIEPVAWRPPRATGFTGRYAQTARLGRIRRLIPQEVGPEALSFDREGNLLTGLLDGRILRIDARGRARTVVSTGGRPLGIVEAEDGTLYVADVRKGLLAVAPTGEIRVLVDSFGGRRMKFVDDVDLLPDGTLVFTDASTRFGLEDYKLDLIEHRPYGRVFTYDPASQRTTLLADGLYFANGITTSADGTFALACETGAYRIQRIDLVGPTRGRMRPFVENLPGFCDNLRRSEDGSTFWVALPSPRDALLDGVAGSPFLRRMIVRLPRFVQPGPKSWTTFVGLRADGTVADAVHHVAEGAYGPVTTVIDHGGELYFGSLSARGIGVVARP